MNFISKRKELAILVSVFIPYSFSLHAESYIQNGGNTVYGNISSWNSYDQIDINATVDASGTPLSGFGLYNVAGTVVNPTINISTEGLHADGLRQNNAQTMGSTDAPLGELTIGDNLSIKTSGISADGINMSITNSSIVNIGNNANIETADGIGVRVNLSRVSNAVKNTINIGDNLVVTTHGDGSNIGVDSATEGSNNLGGNDKTTGYAVYVGNRDYETEPQGTKLNVAYANIGNNSTLTTTGNNAHAVYANKTGTVSLGSTVIKTTGEASHGLFAQDGDVTNVDRNTFQPNSPAVHYGGGVINLLGDTTITVDTTNDGTDKQSYAMYSSGLGSMISSSNGNNTLDSNIYTINGDMRADNEGEIDLTMNNGSVFNGNTSSDGVGNIFLNINGKNSSWNMTKDSSLYSLKLDGSSVSLGDQSVPLNGTNNVTLSVLQLEGNGTFNMRADIGGQRGDLIVAAIASGNHKLNIINNGSSNTTGNETLTVVKSEQNTAQFTLANKVELGAYEYGLRPVSGSPTDFELYSSGPASGGKTTSTANAAGSFLNIGYLTSYIDNQTLLQRLGDLRNSEAAGAKSGGLWIREFGGKLTSFSGSKLSGFDMSYTGTQLGIDKKIDVTSGNLLIGVMAGYTRTNPNYSRGDGDGKNYTAGLYATYLLDNGLYVDSVLKYNSMRNHFNVKDTAGNAVKGTGKTQGIMASVEVGKRFWITDNQQGFYLEPQAQLSYGYQSGDSVNSSNGLKVGLSHYNSTLGRASAIIGYQVQGENPINVYLKTGIVREMSGGASYRFNDGIKNNHTFRSSWFDNGIGANININKTHNIYAEADYSTGNHFDNAMLNVGYRYSF